MVAKENIELYINKESILKDEEFEVEVTLKDSIVSSFTLQIYFDMIKLEYVDNLDNANFSENRVIYTGLNENINKEEKIEVTNKFTFKAKDTGNANIVVTGKFYDADGNEIEIEDKNIQIVIKNQDNKNDKSTNNESQNLNNKEVITDDNTNLKIMRLSEVGISPAFDRNIKQYYLLVDNSIKNIDVTAIPENEESQVVISGNKNLKLGLNTIKIDVISKDRTKSSTYMINVTKTNNKEKANADLENLEIKQVDLNPEFEPSITNYNIEVSNDTEKLDIIAVAQKHNAKVEIIGNDALQIGDNTIGIVVTAENGETIKKYTINAVRRNSYEEIEAQKQANEQEEQLQTIIANLQEENETRQNGENVNLNRTKGVRLPQVIISTIIITMIIGGTIYFVIRKYKK